MGATRPAVMYGGLGQQDACRALQYTYFRIMTTSTAAASDGMADSGLLGVNSSHNGRE
jgi:hypothetical protein